MTGRLQNGATFNMTTRDVNSGTRNTAANNTGIDPSWAVGVNDSGNTLATNAATTLAADAQDSIGHDANGNPLMRFSGKTSGGLVAQTVENSRMGIGTLVLADSLKASTAGSATPLNPLAYNPNPSTDTADQQPIDFVYPTAQTIINGSYVIWQQEQYVTVKAPNSAYASESAAQWAATTDLQTGIQGDTPNTSVPLQANVTSGSNVLTDSGDLDITTGGFVVGQTITSAAFPAGTTVTGITYNTGGSVQSVTLSQPANTTGTISDLAVSGGNVANFRANILNAQKIAGGTTQYLTTLDPGDQLVAQKFILPQFMAVQKAYDGGPVTANSTFDINNNPSGYDAAYSNAFLGTSLAGGFSPAGVGPFMNNAGGTRVSTLIGSNPLTVPNASGSGGYYGQSVRGQSTTIGSTIGAESPVAFADGDIGITTSNYLFGNFNNNGVRDYSSFETGVYALKALFNSGLGTDANDNLGKTNDGTEIPDSVLNAVEPGLATVLGSTSSFVGQRGSSDATNPNDIGVAPVTAKGVSKGDLIVMGDYNGAGEFNGQDIYDMAIGTTLSNTVGGTPTLGVADLNSTSGVTNGVLNKNGALNFVQSQTSDATYSGSGSATAATNASGFIRLSGRSVLTAASPAAVPSGATDLGITNGSGQEEFTYDPTGAYAFNSADVNRAGLVDFNDAVIVDSFFGQSYTNLANSLAATIPTPVTGAPEPVSLVVVQQVDGESPIGQADLNVVNSQLTGTGNANWYGYNVDKTGPGTINWQRTGGTVTVYQGASFTIGGGTVQVGGTVDPFTDNSGNAATAGNHVALTVNGGATLQFTQTQLTSTVSSLTIDTVTKPSQVNMGSNTLAIDYTPGQDPAASIRGYLASGYNLDKWTGAGIVSSIAASNPGLYAVGYADGSVDQGTPAAANQILIENTLAGDANLDGTVNFADLLVVAQNFNHALDTHGNPLDWADGDFNYDGNVNFADLLLLAQNFNKSLTSSELAQLPTSFAADWQLAEAEVQAGESNNVPDPGTISLLAVGAAGLMRRRRRVTNRR
jgi:hypothetical protein